MARRRGSARRRRRGGSGFLDKLLSVLLICGCLVAAITLFFRVDTVVITGEKRYTEAEIRQASGVEDGDNLFLLNKYQVIRNIAEALPYIEIENTRIQRKLPDTLLIQVQECGDPLAWTQDGTVWLMSPAGKIVEQTDTAAGHPTVDGCELLAPSVGTQIAVDTAYETRRESLLELLAVLDETEQEAFDGLLRLEIQRKVESNGSILTMQDLRTLAVSAGADCCHVVGATSDAELGRFYAENGFMEELDGLSDDVFEMLDFGKIGKALRTGENGTFTRSGYVVKHSELVTAPPCAKELPEKPEYLFRLTLGLHPDLEDDRTVTLELPASAEALWEVQKQLGADGWESAMVLDYDGIIPQAAEFADLPMELDAFNDFAEAVEAMPSREKQIPKLKALLEHFEVTDLATAAGLAEHIGDYILTPEISSPQEAAIDELNFTMDAHSAELLLPHVNLFTYGNEIIKDDNAALTSYGLLHREDYQPMQTPVQETQDQAMTME